MHRDHSTARLVDLVISVAQHEKSAGCFDSQTVVVSATVPF